MTSLDSRRNVYLSISLKVVNFSSLVSIQYPLQTYLRRLATAR